MKKMMIIAGTVVCTLAYGDGAVGNVKALAGKTDSLVMRWTDAQQLNMTQAAQEKLVELQLINDQATAEVTRKQQEYEKQNQDYNSKKSTLSKAAREAEEAKLVAMKNEITTLIETSKLKVSRAVQEKTEEMVVAVEQAAAEVAKKQGIDVIVDTASGRTLYVSEKAVITDDLVKEMNKQFELKTAKNKDANKKPVVKA